MTSQQGLQKVAQQASPSNRRSRRFFIETWGCQMNELDTQRMTGQLMQQGLLPTRDPDEADVVLLNSCSVREKAAQKAYSRLGSFRAAKRHADREGTHGEHRLMIGFCGCVAQQEGEAALRRLPELNFVLGPARVGELADILHRCETGERVVATGFPEDRDYDLDSISREGEYKGMVTIIEGCNKNCTFCIVPTTRGPERSRRIEDILREVQHLLDYGFVEIELLGQTVNHWRDPARPELDFADLLEAVSALPGLERLRFVTSYPRDFTPRMVEQMGRQPNICPYLHLPVQSGSDTVLRRMGRGYTVEAYRDLVRQLRVARPGLALSTDLIVGFPGETEEDFQATLQLVEETRFSSLYAFCYSPRPGTAAPRLGGEVAPEVASRRLQDLLGLQESIQRELNAALVGEEMEVLVTGPGKESGSYNGRTTCHRIVHFSSGEPLRLGSLTRVRIEQAFPHSLVAEHLAGESLIDEDLAGEPAPSPLRARTTLPGSELHRGESESGRPSLLPILR